MALYAYCVLRLLPDEAWPVSAGIDGCPVFPFRCDKYTLLLSRLDPHFRFTARSIVEHGQVIARAFETHTVLPMRFGTFFHSEKQISNLVRENRTELLESFCRLRGKAEMRVRLVSLPAPGEVSKRPPQKTPFAGEDSPGVSEQTIDRQTHALVAQLAARMREMFRPLEEQVSCRMDGGSSLTVDCAHLIESQRVETYQKVGQHASGRQADYAIRTSGPWPPYHFLPASVRMPAMVPMSLRTRSFAAAR